MSKQKGVIKLEGNLGGISFYVSDGQYLARVAGGPSKERIQNDPAFKRTRENNKEFGGSAKAAKALRLSMGGLLQTMAGSRLVSRLTALFKAINLRDTGLRGQRAIKLSANMDIIQNLEFNKKISFSTVFAAPFTASNNVDRNEGTMVIPIFSPDSFINAPSGATHFRLVTALGVISDYEYDAGIKGYVPAVPGQDSLGAVTYGAMLDLTAPTTVQTLVSALAGAPVIDAEATVIQTLGIEFFQRIGTEDYLFAQDNAMKVINVF